MEVVPGCGNRDDSAQHWDAREAEGLQAGSQVLSLVLLRSDKNRGDTEHRMGGLPAWRSQELAPSWTRRLWYGHSAELALPSPKAPQVDACQFLTAAYCRPTSLPRGKK